MKNLFIFLVLLVGVSVQANITTGPEVTPWSIVAAGGITNGQGGVLFMPNVGVSSDDYPDGVFQIVEQSGFVIWSIGDTSIDNNGTGIYGNDQVQIITITADAGIRVQGNIALDSQFHYFGNGSGVTNLAVSGISTNGGQVGQFGVIQANGAMALTNVVSNLTNNGTLTVNGTETVSGLITANGLSTATGYMFPQSGNITLNTISFAGGGGNVGQLNMLAGFLNTLIITNTLTVQGFTAMGNASPVGATLSIKTSASGTTALSIAPISGNQTADLLNMVGGIRVTGPNTGGTSNMVYSTGTISSTNGFECSTNGWSLNLATNGLNPGGMRWANSNGTPVFIWIQANGTLDITNVWH